MEPFATETAARQFFIDRIVEQARRAGVSLSEAESQMLRWSESAPDSVAEPALAERFAAETSDADYESKIVGLLRAGFAQDIEADPRAKERWTAALKVLRRGDHYILVMIDRAISGLVKPWWRIW